MTDKMQSAYLASLIIEVYYDKLREITFMNNEDSEEFKNIIDKLKRATEGEESLYNELTNEEISKMTRLINKNTSHTPAKTRAHSKLLATYRSRHNRGINIELSDIITSKLIIDVLKMTTLKILKLSETDIDENCIENLLMYNQIYKYSYLSGNRLIEKIALQYEYDILSLPNITFGEIEKKSSTSFIEKSAELALDFIKNSINELLDIKTDDKYLEMYITLFEVSRIEVMLPILNKEMLEDLSKYLHRIKTDKEDNSAIKKIKSLVNKRKKELS